MLCTNRPSGNVELLRMTPRSSFTVLPDLTLDDYRELERRLKHYVRKRVSHPDDVDDLVQDIFVKAVRTWRDKEAPRNLVAWLFTAARTTVIDHYRKRKIPIGDTELEKIPLQMADDDFRAELSDCLVPIIQKMDDKYRDALMATDIFGQSLAAAAENQNLSLSAMKSRVLRGRNRLKAALQQCCIIGKGSGRAFVNGASHFDCTCDGC